jgi:hypothetical protein
MPGDFVPKMAPPKASPDATIWRYTSIHALLTLLTDHTLMFHQFKKLQDNDAREGMTVLGFWDSIERQQNGDASSLRDSAENNRERLLYFTYASCWNMAEYESALMWKGYAPGGIAVKTTVGDLEATPIARLMDENQTNLSRAKLRQLTIEYADNWNELEAKGYAHDGIPPNRLFLHLKRNAFKSEAEVRFEVMPAIPSGEYQRQPDGRYLGDVTRRPEWCPVVFEDLGWVRQIVAAPSTPKWAAAPLERLTKDKGISFTVSGI